MNRFFLALALLAGLAGCASVPMGDAKQDAALKTFRAPVGTAGLYIYRNESFGAAVKMEVGVDGAAIGQTAAKTYLYKELVPGKHTVTGKAENTDSVDIDVKAGTLSYLWQEVKMGVLFARNKLHLVDEAEGKKGVLESNLAETK